MKDTAVSGTDTHKKNIKIGITISRKVGKAHTRNMVKRRFRAIVNEMIHEMNDGFMIILRPGYNFQIMDFEFEKKVIQSLFKKAGLIDCDCN